MILDNPFHVLGLLADAGVRKRARREARTKAYLRVGKPLVFKDDIYFPGCRRNQGTVDKALSDLHDAVDRIAFGLFWFTESGRPVDQFALRKLRGADQLDMLQGEDPLGGLDQAITVWARVEGKRPSDTRDASRLNNLGTACLLRVLSSLASGHRWPDGLTEPMEYVRRGLRAKARVVGSLADAELSTYCETFGDDISASDADRISDVFGEALERFAEESRKYGLDIPGSMLAEVLRDGGSRTARLSDRFVRDSRRELEEATKACAETASANPSGAADAGRRLMAVGNQHLPEIRSVLGPAHIGYTTLADHACDAVVNAAVAHWNYSAGESGERDPQADLRVARVCRRFANWAHEHACGTTVRERAKGNLATVAGIIAEATMATVRMPIKEWLDRAYELLRSSASPRARNRFVRASLLGTTDGEPTVVRRLRALRDQGRSHLDSGFAGSEEMLQVGSLVCNGLMGNAVRAYNEAPSGSSSERDAADLLRALRDHFGPVSAPRLSGQIRGLSADPVLTRTLVPDPDRQADATVLFVEGEVWTQLLRNIGALPAKWQLETRDRIHRPVRTPPVSPRTPSTTASTKQGCLIIAVLFATLLLLLAIIASDAPDSVTTPSTVPARASTATPQAGLQGERDSSAAARDRMRPESSPTFTMPPVASDRLLSLPELRWCVRQGRFVAQAARDVDGMGRRLNLDRGRIDSARPDQYSSESQVRTFNADIERYNRDVKAYEMERLRHNDEVADYNNRCGNFRYLPGDLERARREVVGNQ